MDEYRQAQPVSGYPIKLPLGLKKLRSHDDSEIIRAYADILGSLMQPTYGDYGSQADSSRRWYR